MKVAYVYSGARKNRLHGVINVDYPDTSLYGANHLEKISGLAVDVKETSDFVSNSFLRKILGFRLLHALTYFFTLDYDIVLGPSLFYALILRKIYGTRPQFMILNISLTRFIQTKKSRLARKLIGWILGEARAIICFSQVQKDFLVHALSVYKGEITVVPLGVDAVYYVPHYEGREGFILSAGRDNGRDYATVVETARRLPEKNFVIVCSKRNLVGIKDIPSNVAIKYDISVHELRELEYQAEFMLLITHDDAFQDGSDCSGQTVLLEAMAAGLPVIASRKKYIHEYVKEGDDALLVDFYDVDDIIKNMGMLEDPSRRLKMAHSARERVEKEFSTHRMAERLYRVILDVSGLPL